MKKDVENQGPGFGHTQKCCQIKRLIGFHPFPLDNWMSNGNIQTIKNLHRFAST